MSLIPNKSQLEEDLAMKDAGILQGAEALNSSAAVLTNVNRQFWELPDERLLAVLNHDVQNTLAVFAANTAAGTMINSLLDQVADPRFTNRAPVTMGRADVAFESGAFVIVPPSPEEEEPGSEPQD